jgi:hypothetical protein
MAVRLCPFPADSAEVVSGWARTPTPTPSLSNTAISVRPLTDPLLDWEVLT